MYTSIVVPLDGSAFGKRALPIALALARRSDAAVHLVHVHEHMVSLGGGPAHDTRLHNDVRREMQADLTAVAAQLGRESSLRITAAFLDGPVVPTLQGFLAEGRHDLVVMMTHGRGGLSRAWLGSVADGLVRHATVPLLLVREGAERPGDPVDPLFAHILVPLDGSAMADEVLDHAISLSTPDATVYTLLTVVVPQPLALLQSPSPGGGSFTGPSALEDQRDAALAHLEIVARELRESGARVETLVVMHQQPAQCILDTAEEQHVDSIALSTHARDAAARLLLGSVADKVIRGATVPVLVYRPAGGRAVSVEIATGGAATVGGAPATPWVAGRERLS